MNRRTCPNCGARLYFSDSRSDWDCPICGKDLGEVPNDRNIWRDLVKVLEDDRVLEKANNILKIDCH